MSKLQAFGTCSNLLTLSYILCCTGNIEIPTLSGKRAFFSGHRGYDYTRCAAQPQASGMVPFHRPCPPILTDAIVRPSMKKPERSYETPQVFIASRESSEDDENGSVHPYRESSSNDPS